MVAIENRIKLSEAARHFGVHPSAIWRWCRRGLLAANGERVRLAHTRFGRTIYTTEAALDTFGAELAQADVERFESADTSERAATGTRPRSESRREKEIARAERDLQRAGV